MAGTEPTRPEPSAASTRADARVSEVRALLTELRVAIVDQASLGLQGADLPPAAARGQQTGVAARLRPKAPQRLPVAAAPATFALDLAGLYQEGARPTLKQVRERLGDCQRCKLHESRTTIVFGSGDEHASIVFVGEGPGRDEDLEGEPFVGEAGKLLARMLQAMGTSRRKVYIANAIKCRPPKNRFPERDELAACVPFLLAQINAIAPQVVVALGRCALENLLGRPAKISKERGQWLTLPTSHGEVALMPTFHPAYLLRNPGDKKLVWQDLQAVMQRLDMPLPAARAP